MSLMHPARVRTAAGAVAVVALSAVVAGPTPDIGWPAPPVAGHHAGDDIGWPVAPAAEGERAIGWPVPPAAGRRAGDDIGWPVAPAA